jgi:hypothetical protein
MSACETSAVLSMFVVKCCMMNWCQLHSRTQRWHQPSSQVSFDGHCKWEYQLTGIWWKTEWSFQETRWISWLLTNCCITSVSYAHWQNTTRLRAARYVCNTSDRTTGARWRFSWLRCMNVKIYIYLFIFFLWTLVCKFFSLVFKIRCNQSMWVRLEHNFI